MHASPQVGLRSGCHSTSLPAFPTVATCVAVPSLQTRNSHSYTSEPGHLRRTPLVHTHTHRRCRRLMFHNSVTRCVCVRAGACNRIPTCASPCVAVRTPSSSARASALNTPPWRRHSRVHAAVPAASLRGFALRACAASSSARAITSSATIRPDLVAPSIESM